MNQLQELEFHKAVKASEFHKLFNPDNRIRKSTNAKKISLPPSKRVTKDQIEKAFAVLGIGGDNNDINKATAAEMEEIMHPRNKGRYVDTSKGDNPTLHLSNPTHKEKLLDYITDEIVRLRESGNSFDKDDSNEYERSLGNLEWGGKVDHNILDIARKLGITLAP